MHYAHAFDARARTRARTRTCAMHVHDIRARTRCTYVCVHVRDITSAMHVHGTCTCVRVRHCARARARLRTCTCTYRVRTCTRACTCAFARARLRAHVRASLRGLPILRHFYAMRDAVLHVLRSAMLRCAMLAMRSRGLRSHDRRLAIFPRRLQSAMLSAVCDLRLTRCLRLRCDARLFLSASAMLRSAMLRHVFDATDARHTSHDAFDRTSARCCDATTLLDAAVCRSYASCDLASLCDLAIFAVLRSAICVCDAAIFLICDARDLAMPLAITLRSAIDASCGVRCSAMLRALCLAIL
jgi:hypothetical protein